MLLNQTCVIQYVIMNEKEIDKIIDKAIKRNNDQNAVVLENMRSDFKMFGELLSSVRDEVKQNGKRIDSLENKVDVMDNRLGSLENKVDSMNDKLDANFEETGRLKVEKVDREELEKIDIRLTKFETQTT